jgi:hypothetical protein
VGTDLALDVGHASVIPAIHIQYPWRK